MKILLDNDNRELQKKYEEAVAALKRNTIRPFKVDENKLDKPIIICGGGYDGVWIEESFLESVTYGNYSGDYEPAVALINMIIDVQRDDGHIPFAIIEGKTYWSQIQEVISMAEYTWTTYRYIQDKTLLEKAYKAFSKWDAWLSKYRDRRNLGLIELFCEFDSSMDNCKRFDYCKGMTKVCPPSPETGMDDCTTFKEVGTLPWLAPDMSATLFAQRRTLSLMANELGLSSEADIWRQKAEKTRCAILTYLFDPETMFFYDLDCNNRFVRIMCDTLSRVLCEHVVDQRLFEELFKRHVMNPHEFWTPYPMPSIAASDPMFDGFTGDKNSWSGPVVALIALRTPQMFEYYGKSSELTHMMKQWIKALVNKEGFWQQLNPFTGESTGYTDTYTTSMLVLIDYTARLYGVRRELDVLEWNCRLPEYSTKCSHICIIPSGEARIVNNGIISTIEINGKIKYEVRGICRLITDLNGEIISIVGTEPDTVKVDITCCTKKSKKMLELEPNRKVRWG